MKRSFLLSGLPSLFFLGALNVGATAAQRPLFEQTFDAHWECLRDNYPYFELYRIDWEAERRKHRPRALAAGDADHFAWAMARLIASLPDAHVAFLPAISTLSGRWSYPELSTQLVERRVLLVEWDDRIQPPPPEPFRGAPQASPEITAVQGLPPTGAGQILAAGPVGSTLELRLRWPDGIETDHKIQRPLVSNLPPADRHYGEDWLLEGQVGAAGYLRIRTFDPKRATLGPDGKITTMLRSALRELGDTQGLILDLQGNGGGLVAASDPFLGHFLRKRRSYRWGRSGGKRRVIRPRRPTYDGQVVVLVDGGTASGGEWAARILKEAGRAVVIGERTAGAEAAVHSLTAPDGSQLFYSAWPMVEPGVEPFQEVGIELDHHLPLTIEEVRRVGYERALESVRRARVSRGLEVLGLGALDLEAFLGLALREESGQR